ncbi:MAG: hypothetical protein ACAI38_02840 [Myxococcota bacterium]
MRWLVGLFLVLSPRVALAYHDDWTGPDKVQHFAVAGALAAGTYGVVAIADEDLQTRLLAGLLVAGGAALGKEAIDAAGNGDPSFRDLAWDGAGIATGLLTAFAFDMLVQWISEP